MNMDIDEAGSDDHAPRVNDLIGFAVKFSHRREIGYAALGQQEIVGSIKVLRGIEKPAVFDSYGH